MSAETAAAVTSETVVNPCAQLGHNFNRIAQTNLQRCARCEKVRFKAYDSISERKQ